MGMLIVFKKSLTLIHLLIPSASCSCLTPGVVWPNVKTSNLFYLLPEACKKLLSKFQGNYDDASRMQFDLKHKS